MKSPNPTRLDPKRVFATLILGLYLDLKKARAVALGTADQTLGNCRDCASQTAPYHGVLDARVFFPFRTPSGCDFSSSSSPSFPLVILPHPHAMSLLTIRQLSSTGPYCCAISKVLEPFCVGGLFLLLPRPGHWGAGAYPGSAVCFSRYPQALWENSIFL